MQDRDARPIFLTRRGRDVPPHQTSAVQADSFRAHARFGTMGRRSLISASLDNTPAGVAHAAPPLWPRACNSTKSGQIGVKHRMTKHVRFVSVKQLYQYVSA